MTTTTTRDRNRPLVIDIEQEFPVTPDRVFRRWTDAAALARWFAPPGYITLSSTADARPGGTWQLNFQSEISRHEYTEQGTFHRVDPYERLELTLTQVDGERANPETLVTVTFVDIGTPGAPRTRMRFTQDGYRSLSLFKDNEQGWRGCFAALADDLLSNDPESSDGQADTDR